MSVSGCFDAAWRIKLMISASAKWQELCGLDDPLDHIAIYYGEDSETSRIPFPRCIIHDSSEGGTTTLTRESLAQWRREGTILGIFELEVPDSAMADTYEKRGNWVVTQTGAIIQDIQELTNPPVQAISGGMPLNLASITSAGGPGEVPYEERVPSAQAVDPLWFHMIEFSLVP